MARQKGFFELFSTENLKNKTDWFLILGLSISLFLWDVAMNKVATHGKDYMASITGTFLVPMVTMMWIGGILVLIFLGALLYRATANRKGHIKWDILMGVFAFFCYAFLLLGGLLQIFHVDEFPLIAWDVFTITAYHWIAIFGLILSMIYFILTE